MCFQPGEEGRTSLITRRPRHGWQGLPDLYLRHQLLHSLSPSPPPRREGFPGVSGLGGRARRVSPVRSSKGRGAGAGREAKLWPQIRSAPFTQAARKPRPHVPSAPGPGLGGKGWDGNGPRGQVGLRRVPEAQKMRDTGEGEGPGPTRPRPRPARGVHTLLWGSMACSSRSLICCGDDGAAVIAWARRGGSGQASGRAG